MVNLDVNVTLRAIESFVESEDYRQTAKSIADDYGINLIELDPRFVVQSSSEKIAKAQTTVDQLIQLLHEETDSLKRFSHLKLRDQFGKPVVQEFRSGDDQGDQTASDREEGVQGLGNIFLLMYLLEYQILKNKPEFLDEYLALIRIPNRKKYAKELKSCYEKAVT